MPMRRTKPSRSRTVAVSNAKTAASANAKQAEALMDLAVDAARSRHLPDYLNRFSTRAAALAEADWGGVVVFQENGAELYSDAGLSSANQLLSREWLVLRAQEVSRDAQVCILPQEKSSTCVFVPILSSSNERLGALCLLRAPRALHAGE